MRRASKRPRGGHRRSKPRRDRNVSPRQTLRELVRREGNATDVITRGSRRGASIGIAASNPPDCKDAKAPDPNLSAPGPPQAPGAHGGSVERQRALRGALPSRPVQADRSERGAHAFGTSRGREHLRGNAVRVGYRGGEQGARQRRRQGALFAALRRARRRAIARGVSARRQRGGVRERAARPWLEAGREEKRPFRAGG